MLKTLMARSELTGEIYASPENIAKEVNKLPPEIPWREWLRRVVGHELAHKDLSEFLLQHIPKGEIGTLHGTWLSEIYATNVVPRYPAELASFRKRFLEKSAEYWEDWWDVATSEMAVYAIALTEEDIRGKKLDEPYQEVLLGLKEISRQIWTKEDVLRFLHRADELENKIWWE